MNEAMSAGIKIFCYGCCLFVVEWIENGCIEPAEKQAEYIYTSVPDALLQVIR